MKTLSLPLVLLLAVASPAFASDHDRGKHDCPMHDPSVTDAERAKHMDAMFAKLDADGSGAIDRAEFDKHHEDMRRGPEEDAKAAPEADEHAAHH